MKVELISYTPDALDLLLFTKSTRLTLNGMGLETVRAWPEERKRKELEYMRGTIQSSWEFVEYVFSISGVTRAFTHQLVRHRIGTSFAQQTMRALEMNSFEYLATGPELNLDGPEGGTSWRTAAWRDGPDPGDNPSNIYDSVMQNIDERYHQLIKLGVKPQDARGILPTNILTGIVFKANLRTLHEMGLKRLCVKAQGEFQDVFRAMRERVVDVHPWADDFIRVHCAWHGSCAFPALPMEECPVKPHVYNPVTATAYDGGAPSPVDQIHALNILHRAEVQPRVKTGFFDQGRNDE